MNTVKAEKLDYVYLRMADTIKHIVTEARLESYDELEVSKRTDDSIRNLHNQIDLDLRKHFKQPEIGEQIIGYNRTKLIMERKSWEFTNPPIISKKIIKKLKKNPILISDIRGLELIKLLLAGGWYGIFIDDLFNHKEFSNNTHDTEYNLFEDKETLRDLIKKYGFQMDLITVRNSKNHNFLVDLKHNASTIKSVPEFSDEDRYYEISKWFTNFVQEHNIKFD